MQKLLRKIFLLTTVFTCSFINQNNAVKIKNCTEKQMLIKIIYDKSKCSQLIRLNGKINSNEFFCPTFKIEPKKSKDLNFTPEDIIQKIIIEFIVQKNNRLRFTYQPNIFTGSNIFFLTLQPDLRTTFQLYDEYDKPVITNWTLKISNDSEGKEGHFNTTSLENTSNSY